MKLMPLTHNTFYLEAFLQVNVKVLVTQSCLNLLKKEKNRFNASKGEAACGQSIQYF